MAARGKPRRSSAGRRPRARPALARRWRGRDLLPLLATLQGDGRGIVDVARVAQEAADLVEGQVEDVVGPVEPEADAEVQAEAAQPGDGDPDRGGLAPLPQREDPLGPRQAASGQGAVAQRGDQPGLGPQPGGLVLGGDVGRDPGCAHGLLQLVQQPVRAFDDRRAGDLVAHGPLSPKVLVPRELARRWSGRARRRRPAWSPPAARRPRPRPRTERGELLLRGGRARRRGRQPREEVHQLRHRASRGPGSAPARAGRWRRRRPRGAGSATSAPPRRGGAARRAGPRPAPRSSAERSPTR